MATSVSGSFEDVAQSNLLTVTECHVNVSVMGEFAGSINVERSFDKGDSWGIVDVITEPTEAVYFEPEFDVRYRLNATAIESGQADYRLAVPSRFR